MKRLISFMICVMLLVTAGCSNNNESAGQLDDLESQGIVLGQNVYNKNLYLISTDIEISEVELQAILKKTTDEIIGEYTNLYWLDVSSVSEQGKEYLISGSLITYTLLSNVQKDTRPPTITVVDISI